MIGIFVAMTLEREEIQKLMTDYKIETYLNADYYIGKLADKDVLLVAGGVGKVASAITCCAMIEHFHCDTIINIGTAGGIKENENVLDVVVADKVSYHDWDVKSINDMETNFDSMADSNLVFYSDAKFVALAQKIMSEFSEHQTFVGPIVSGDCFVKFQDRVDYIQKHFPEAIACEMESASIGHVCSTYGVPFLIIRSLSDIVIKEGNELDFLTYASQASARAAKFTERFVKEL